MKYLVAFLSGADFAFDSVGHPYIRIRAWAFSRPHKLLW